MGAPVCARRRRRRCCCCCSRPPRPARRARRTTTWRCCCPTSASPLFCAPYGISCLRFGTRTPSSSRPCAPAKQQQRHTASLVSHRTPCLVCLLAPRPAAAARAASRACGDACRRRPAGAGNPRVVVLVAPFGTDLVARAVVQRLSSNGGLPLRLARRPSGVPRRHAHAASLVALNGPAHTGEKQTVHGAPRPESANKQSSRKTGARACLHGI